MSGRRKVQKRFTAVARHKGVVAHILNDALGILADKNLILDDEYDSHQNTAGSELGIT